MFDDGPTLYSYECDDGTTVMEDVQDVPWSSGPCIYLKLVNEKGETLFRWDSKDMAG
jgi:hypothetical protein